MEQGKEDTYRLLLVPGEYHGKRQFIYAAVKCLGQSHSYLYCTVGVVTLSHIHDSWKSTDFADIKVIKSVFSAG